MELAADLKIDRLGLGCSAGRSLSCEAQAGHKQRGHRPAILVSPRIYNSGP